MNVHVDARTHGENLILAISISATDVEATALIDSLSLAGGYPEIIAGKLASVVGLVDVPSSSDLDMARVLDHFARELRERSRGESGT